MEHSTMGWRDSRELAGQVLEVVARARGRLEPGGDADGERVAADTG